MSRYQLHYNGTTIIEHLADGMGRNIPVAQDNADYLAYIKWRDAGNVADPADPAPMPDPQEVADNVLLDQLRTDYLALKAGLDSIQTTTAQLMARANTLSTITISGTLPQTQVKLQTTLQALGTDLGTMITSIDQISKGSERVLNGLAVLVRRVRGNQ